MSYSVFRGIDYSVGLPCALLVVDPGIKTSTNTRSYQGKADPSHYSGYRNSDV